MLSVETKRTTREEEQRQDRMVEQVTASAQSMVFEMATFGPKAAAVKSLFNINPFVFDGMNIPNGIEFPNLKNWFVDILLGEITARLRTS